jgi:hypothetical protein
MLRMQHKCSHVVFGAEMLQEFRCWSSIAADRADPSLLVVRVRDRTEFQPRDSREVVWITCV